MSESFPSYSSPPGTPVTGPGYGRPPAASASRGGLFARLGWEALLLVLALVAVGIAVAGAGGRHPEAMVLPAAILGVFATAFALSLRTATPNLAVTAVGTLSGLIYAKVTGADELSSVPLAIAFAVGAAALIGVVLAVLVGLLSVPAWAASLATVAAVQAVLVAVTDGQVERVGRDGMLRASWVGYVVLAVVLLASIAGGLLWANPGVRRALGANRVAGNPVGFSAGRLVGAAVGLIGSSVLGGLGGVLFAARVGVGASAVDFNTLFLALGVVLLGGVSAYGARGGFAGTALAVLIIAAVQTVMQFEDAPFAYHYALAALAALIGFVVGRLLEFLDGPFPGPAVAGHPAPGAPTLADRAPVPFATMPAAPVSAPGAPPAPPTAVDAAPGEPGPAAPGRGDEQA
jgi:ribose transport system permease protein